MLLLRVAPEKWNHASFALIMQFAYQAVDWIKILRPSSGIALVYILLKSSDKARSRVLFSSPSILGDTLLCSGNDIEPSNKVARRSNMFLEKVKSEGIAHVSYILLAITERPL